MEYRTLGASRLEVSALSLGSWKTFEFMPEQEGLAVMQAAVDGGINLLDDARYDDTSGKAPIKTGYSEVVFGNLLRAGGFTRDDLVISNRMWFEFYPEQSFEAEIDGSLSRIGIDYFDLVFCFTPPADLSPEQLVEQLASVVATGKVRHWASGNWPVALLEECCAIAADRDLPSPTAAMVPYGPSNRAFVETEQIQSLCSRYDVALVASYSLQGGVLTGKYNSPGAAATVRYAEARMDDLRQSGMLDKAAEFVALAAEADCTPAQLAYAFALRPPQVASVLFGATSVAQVDENLAALGMAARLDDDLLAKIDAIFPVQPGSCL